jgi:hypothetical protein
MPQLKGSKTHEHLKDAFAGESQANRRYLYFASKADVEGHQRRRRACSARPPKARPATRTATSSTWTQCGDPATGLPIGSTAPEPEGGHRRRDARVHRHVPGHGQGPPATRASTRSPTGSRRWPRPSARTPTSFAEGAGSAWPPETAVAVDGCPARTLGRIAAVRRTVPHCVSRARPCRRPTMTVREGSLEAPTRHPIDWKNPDVLRRGRPARRNSNGCSTSATAAAAA